MRSFTKFFAALVVLMLGLTCFEAWASDGCSD